MKLYTILETILKSDSCNIKLIDNQGDLMLNKIHDLVDKTDENLIGLLLENQDLREKFFIKIKDVYVFKTSDFKFFLDENKIDNSYTQYENRIGLTSGGKFLKDSSDVVLDFPYKDCFLEGGQSTEEGTDTYFEYDQKDEHYIEKQAKRKEIFFNTVLAKDEIDRLLEPKAFTNIKKYSLNGEENITSFNRDENGLIKDNLIIKGNNLLALHTLKSEFVGKVKLIYIDPPYNTGNDSFAYNDNFNHSTWLTFMRNRLLVAKDLLREDGFLCCHIDNNEGEYLKVLLDEIFKRENELNTFYIRVRYPDKTLKQDMDFHKEIETVLIYRNTNQAKPILNEIETNNDKYVFYFEELGEGKEIELGGKKTIVFSKEEIKIHKKECSDNGRKEIWATGSILDGNSSGRFFRDYLTGRCNEDGYGLVYKVYGIGDEVDGFRYFTGPQKIGATKGKYFQGIPSKSLENENNLKRIPINNFYDLAGSFGNCRNEGGVEFRSGKKPEDLLNIILKHFSNINDIVLDYHLGSGSTCATSLKMNRQYIGIEQMESQINLSKTRLQNVINNDQTGISKTVNWQGGGSFVYLELAKNNQNAIEHIQSCKSYEELVSFFDEMCNKYFLHYNVKVNEFKEKICKEENFKKLNLDQQKVMVAKMLDLNQLYVNVSDMEDKKFALSENDITVTKDFYQI
ncbi:DNA methyltransferase [Flavobacterium sp.]|jgi:adenine-specific DNA-methyltransferase|uniref:DNA methyltransferase n=1 Tax=Flavobacterium sp. TaxID=239 RepID=UPI0037C13EA6